MPRTTALFGPTFRGEAIIRLDDVTVDPRFGTNPPYFGLPEGHLPVRSYLAVPVVARGGEVLGGLFFGHATAGMFTERAERLVIGIAAQAAIALDNVQLYRQLQEALRTRDEFLAAAAHDLKSPLTGIKSMAQLLRRHLTQTDLASGERLAKGLASIDASAMQLSAQIDELLDLTRVQMGRPIELDRRPTDLVDLAQGVIAEQQRTTERHQLRFTSAIPALVGEWDAVRLVRVLDNLLANAVKYSPGGGAIEVSLARENDGGAAWAVLAVRDHGLGIPAADQPRIFERFRRARNVVGRIGGTGIGLASARHLVEQHGGTITVVSQEGVGSTFTVRLPLTPPGDEMVSAPPALTGLPPALGDDRMTTSAPLG
jgi:signal transduction histidine kinase